MEGFAVDLYPWNAVVILAFLTAKEFEEEPFLADAREMAAWRFYDFASDLSCSHPGLGSRMRELYETERGDKAKVAVEFFVACAKAVASKPVRDALAKYDLSGGFKIMIQHPDTGKEYYPPA